MMHKFWIFPLILALVGAAYPVLCTAQTFFAVESVGATFSSRPFDWSREIPNVFWTSLPYGVGAGVLLGLFSAWRDRTHGVAASQNYQVAATRLLSNVGFLLVYALLFLASNWLLVLGVSRAGLVSRGLLRWWFPGIFFVEVGLVNLVAIIWAARRTAHTDDILTPRVALAKLKASTEMTPRKRKPSRRDAEI